MLISVDLSFVKYHNARRGLMMKAEQEKNKFTFSGMVLIPVSLSVFISIVSWFLCIYCFPHCDWYFKRTFSDAITIAGSYIAYATLLFTIISVVLVAGAFYVGQLVLKSKDETHEKIWADVHRRLSSEVDRETINDIADSIAKNPAIKDLIASLCNQREVKSAQQDSPIMDNQNGNEQNKRDESLYSN